MPRGGGGKSEGRGFGAAARRGSGRGGGAGSSTTSASGPEANKGGKAKEEICSEISKLLSANSNSPLSRTDFDGPARQCLHAIHGIGGHQGVHDALQIVKFFTSKKQRSVVRHWPAYLHKLLRKALEDISAEERKKKLAGQTFLLQACADGGGSASSTAAAAPEAGVRPHGGEASTPTASGGPRPLGARAREEEEEARGSLKVPCRIRSGQLTEPDLHSEFICPICLDLCENVTLLPCSHVFCRTCVGTYLDSNNTKEKVGCPQCRAPFTKEEAALDRPADSWLSRWISGIKVCCVFCNPEELPDPDDDPLPPGHGARHLGLSCTWTGTVSAYREHIGPGGSCEVARELRRRQREAAASELRYETPAKESAPRHLLLDSQAQGCAAADELRKGSASPLALQATASAQTPPVVARAVDCSWATPCTPAAKSAVEATATSGSAATVGPDPGSDIGDFIVTCAFRSDCGFRVEVGDIVYISEVESRGWAYAQQLASGCAGWLPRSHCQRHTRRVVDRFSPGQGVGQSSGCLALEKDDLVWVFDRRPNGWVYGERRHFGWGDSLAPSKGWFPLWAIGGK